MDSKYGKYIHPFYQVYTLNSPLVTTPVSQEDIEVDLIQKKTTSCDLLKRNQKRRSPKKNPPMVNARNSRRFSTESVDGGHSRRPSVECDSPGNSRRPSVFGDNDWPKGFRRPSGEYDSMGHSRRPSGDYDSPGNSRRPSVFGDNEWPKGFRRPSGDSRRPSGEYESAGNSRRPSGDNDGPKGLRRPPSGDSRRASGDNECPRYSLRPSADHTLEWLLKSLQSSHSGIGKYGIYSDIHILGLLIRCLAVPLGWDVHRSTAIPWMLKSVGNSLAGLSWIG